MKLASALNEERPSRQGNQLPIHRDFGKQGRATSMPKNRIERSVNIDFDPTQTAQPTAAPPKSRRKGIEEMGGINIKHAKRISKLAAEVVIKNIKNLPDSHIMGEFARSILFGTEREVNRWLDKQKYGKE